ncbi:Death on curing protein, Doc toxin [uncultured Gammaproteobacteria bacterium]|jgi:mRNA interferase MazF|nr:Death on curing protein, Doc toxin [uncultured Gammaproteobacteria bacterium]CAC9571598.1 Death on curing protein, Doc toxin [uncultured Gammaproteobacteria bacterium]CAC9605193.1 Death on curing protein, Doc toxin [uncultured Gammaproteobacteria bacterium]CAC9644906.1 Death on curing protein, Doc toxin [uncultured Gammaproteobacteria bacterium]CAC9646729.1 Death on curing protein, Doc toxin [uncultured Gammaproteobacteria bacterium]
MKQGDIYLINLDPTIGSEMKKTRPCIILNSNSIGKLPLKIIAPITDFKTHYESVPWMVTLKPNTDNNLKKISSIDLFQVRSLSQKRLVKKVGTVKQDILDACKNALNIVFE